MKSGRNLRRVNVRMLTIVLASMTFFAIPAALTQAVAQQQPSEEQIISSSFSGPAFLDAYWADREPDTEESAATRKEVGPGEGAATLAVVLVNRGSSEITSVTGYLSPPSGFSPNGRSASGDAVAAHDQVVEGGATFTLYFDLDVSDNARVGSYISNLNVKYSRLTEMGGLRDAFIQVPFRLTGKVILEPVPTTRTLEPGVTNDVDFELRNLGSAPATGVTVSIVGITSSTGNAASQEQVANFGSRTYTLGTIPPGSSAPFSSSIFLTTAASGALAGVQLEITYNDAYGNSRTISPTVGMVVQQSAMSLVGIKAVGQDEERPDNQIVAGKVDDFILEISNKGGAPIEDAVISIQPASESINILGDSKWAVESISPDATVRLPTRVFAPSSLIGSSTSFNIALDYLLEGESKSEQIVLGTYVDGEIAIRIYDLAINYIGNTPNLVGNLLNEGNTEALFTTVEIVPQAEGGDQQLSASGAQQQYLGDLTENSPLPFSIPLSARGLEPGTYPVTLKLAYKDNLRNTHELVTSANVVLEQSAASSQAAGSDQRPGGQTSASGLIIALVVAAIVGIAAFVFLRRRKAKTRSISTQDREDDITTILNNPVAEQKDGDAKGSDSR